MHSPQKEVPSLAEAPYARGPTMVDLETLRVTAAAAAPAVVDATPSTRGDINSGGGTLRRGPIVFDGLLSCPSVHAAWDALPPAAVEALRERPTAAQIVGLVEEEPTPTRAADTVETSAVKPLETITGSYIDKARYGERALVLHDVLAPAECDALVELFDHLPLHDASSDHRYRHNLRCEVESMALAAVLTARIAPFLEDAKTVDASNCAEYMQRELMCGEWRRRALNDHFRLCCYDAGGHFGAHYDGEYSPTVDETSIKTVMLYLSDDYEGGETQFLDEHTLHYDEGRGIFCARPGTVHASLKARKGDCLVFDHKILHAGGQVLSGRKHILRTEMMYRRVAGTNTMSEDERKARGLLLEARTFEGANAFDDAVRCYRAAFRLWPALEQVT